MASRLRFTFICFGGFNGYVRELLKCNHIMSKDLIGNREIKFRGYDNDNKKWVYGFYTRVPNGITKFEHIVQDEDGSLVAYYIQNGKTITQYTGLKDKNGVEIYEGDVVRGIDTHSVVLWDKDGFWRIKEVDTKRPTESMICFCYNKTWEVIGNVFENPKLLA